MLVVWKQDNRKYANGEFAYAGKWCVAGVCYDGSTNEAAKHKISIYLPGIRPLKNQISKEVAKTQVENTVNYWFVEAEK